MFGEGDRPGSVGALTEQDDATHSLEETPGTPAPEHVEETPEALEDDAEPGMSFREFAASQRGHEPRHPNFPLLNALRVHMKIAHHDHDLRPHDEFKAALAELTGVKSDG